jgi:hypothetical protein
MPEMPEMPAAGVESHGQKWLSMAASHSRWRTPAEGNDMAIVRDLQALTLERDARHTEAHCTYSIRVDDQGRRYLQIDTYGSSTRKIRDKKSQSIRFAPEAIERLKQILREHF